HPSLTRHPLDARPCRAPPPPACSYPPLFRSAARPMSFRAQNLQTSLPPDTTAYRTRDLHFGAPLVVLDRQDLHVGVGGGCHARPDRKSTRLNSSHQIISYAVFCVKKKKEPAR